MMFNALAIALGLLQVISVIAGPTIKTTTTTTTTKKSDTANPKCAQITQSECTWDKSPLYSPYGAYTIESCQTMCFGETDCATFIWDRNTKQCTLYSKDAKQTCKRIGKPKQPATDCSSDPCADFQNQECTMDGNMLDHFPSVSTEDRCAKICLTGAQGCAYFVYGALADSKECEIRSTDTFKCTVFKGTATGKYDKSCDATDKS